MCVSHVNQTIAAACQARERWHRAGTEREPTRSSPDGPAEQEEGGSLQKHVNRHGRLKSHTILSRSPRRRLPAFGSRSATPPRVGPTKGGRSNDGTPDAREIGRGDGTREQNGFRGETYRPRSVSSLLMRFRAILCGWNVWFDGEMRRRRTGALLDLRLSALCLWKGTEAK
jgi:hypothetical protein